MEVVQVDIEQKSTRMELIEYLTPHESHALFLLGNLFNPTCASVMYIAKKHGRIVGVCGYYPTFQSCSIFSEDTEATRIFAQVMLKEYPSLKAVLGMADIVKPVYDACVVAGKRSMCDPENLFLELKTDSFVPRIATDGTVRSIRKNDVEQVARLQRLIHGVPLEDPLTDEEKARVFVDPMTVCYEIDGKIVAVASTNGLAITCFQILGVATHPAYRRRGYAKAVCSYLICAMKQLGGSTAIIFTGKDNEAALQCYYSLGFRATDRYYAPWFEG